jgi:hypothetical protein
MSGNSAATAPSSLAVTSSISPKSVRVALRVHGVYFVLWALFFEFIEYLPFFKSPPLNDIPVEGATGQMAANIAAGCLFSLAALFFISSAKPQIPRFIYTVTLTQTSINLYHDVLWMIKFGQIPDIFPVIVLDTVIITTLFIIYLTARIKLE